MKNIITAALLFTAITANAADRRCHEINGTGVIKTHQECYDLDKATPGKYWYDKKEMSKDGMKFEPDMTIMMRKKLEEDKKSRTVQQKD